VLEVVISLVTDELVNGERVVALRLTVPRVYSLDRDDVSDPEVFPAWRIPIVGAETRPAAVKAVQILDGIEPGAVAGMDFENIPAAGLNIERPRICVQVRNLPDDGKLDVEAVKWLCCGHNLYRLGSRDRDVVL
jgi:hypothetical protein